MIAPNRKHLESLKFNRGGWGVQELPPASTGQQQRARRAAAALLFGTSEEGEARPPRSASPWAVIAVWVLTVWMLIAVACHFSWMLQSLGRGY